MNQEKILFLSEDTVQKHIRWETLIPAIESVMEEVSKGEAVQPARTIMPIPEQNGRLLTMPGMSTRNQALSCKLVTSFKDNPRNHNLPTIIGTILLFNTQTGQLSAILEGTTITEWRTAAASVVATKHLYSESKFVLAILGCGNQGKSHILAFHHYFDVEIRIWNRTENNARLLAEHLKSLNIFVTLCSSVSECVTNADVIVTATYASTPILELEYINKPNVLINAVGAGLHHHCELSHDIYSKSQIYVDSYTNAEVELKGLKEQGLNFMGEVGEVVAGVKKPDQKGITIFHSLGMAVEDSVAAKLVLDEYLKKIAD